MWLVNPNGMVFGKDAQVNVGGLLATTADIVSNRFLTGDGRFDIAGNPRASIVNDGTINIRNTGLAALIAPTVINNGTITAELGKVQLGSGDTFSLDLYGDGLIRLEASDAVLDQLVDNSGRINVDGGQVKLTAAAAATAVDSLINMGGLIDARTAGGQAGQVEIYAEGSNAVPGNVAADKERKQGSSTVLVSGTIDAAGRNPGEKGGTVELLGDNVGVLSGSLIDASGDAGGGTVRIGGDFHGAGSTPAALNTYVDPNSLILANADASGNGGKVAVWSDATTWFYGNILAEGGMRSGNGGYVETSGHGYLDAEGYVDLMAPHGGKGTYLLDPTNITIYGNFTPGYTETIQGDSSTLASSLKTWLDASDTSTVTLSYNSLGTTATGTSGTTTITVGSNSGLAVGERIQLGTNTSQLASVNDASNIYTITNISGTTITVDANLSSNYSGAGALWRLYQHARR